MKKYWPFLGALSIAATVGFYEYVKHNPLREETNNEEFSADETESAAELPLKTSRTAPAPYLSQKNKIKKTQIKNEPEFSKYDKKTGMLNRVPLNAPTFPKPCSLEQSNLEEALEKEHGKRPRYDLPQEERDFQTWEEVMQYFNAALDEKDYTIAEGYIEDARKLADSKTFEKLQGPEEALSYIIITNYNEYLNEVIKNCKNYDYNSVFRKFMWMNLFAAKHENVFPIYDGSAETELDFMGLFEKGNEALDVMEVCPEAEK